MSYFIFFITTTTLFFLLYLGYVMHLVKLMRYLLLPHHCLTALLYFYMHACKCQLFTDEGSCRLPKRLNYCFSVLASATNRSIQDIYCCQRNQMCKCIHHLIHIIFVGACCVRYATIYKYFHSTSVMQVVIWCHNVRDLHIWYARANLKHMIIGIIDSNTFYIHFILF